MIECPSRLGVETKLPGNVDISNSWRGNDLNLNSFKFIVGVGILILKV